MISMGIRALNEAFPPHSPQTMCKHIKRSVKLSFVTERQAAVEAFRERLGQLMKDSGISKVALARELDVDRTTLTQLLSTGNHRLPRAETLVAISRYANVSVDWLLGLRHDDPERTQMVSEQPSLERDVAPTDDARLLRWLTEVKGAKVRYVPTTLPDLLKSDAVIRYEAASALPLHAPPTIEQAESRLEWQRRPEADMECCSSRQSLEGFARGEGIWRELAPGHRRTQLERIATLADELYPTFRWFLFDGRIRYAAPVTVYGARRAALYIGGTMLVFTTDEHIRAMIGLFDNLIREAVVQPPDIPSLCRQLLKEVR
jgi:transcriptional regulator with XRE-family HTH domain